MKLSEAILKGSKLKPKAIGDLFVFNGKGKVRSCALGAAIDAVAGLELNSEIKEVCGLSDFNETDQLARNILCKEFPILKNSNKLFDHPVSDLNQKNNISFIITNLNDVWGWSRERIAKWVAKQGY